MNNSAHIIIQSDDQHESFIKDAISTIDRLGELVQITSLNEDESGELRIVDDVITLLPNWYDERPPLYLESVNLDQDNLLALVFMLLDNDQAAASYIDEKSELYPYYIARLALVYTGQILEEDLQTLIENSPFNAALVMHYLGTGHEEEKTKLFLSAIANEENPATKSFMRMHFSQYLLDNHLYSEAERELRKALEFELPVEGSIALKKQMVYALSGLLEIPYEKEKLEDIQNSALEIISFYERDGRPVQTALMQVELGKVLSKMGDFDGAKVAISSAVATFKDEDVVPFLGEAGYELALLYYTWSKKDKPYLTKYAMNAFQDVLKVYKKETNPYRYADIQHYLGQIYSGLSSMPEEKALWSAYSASSFQQALDVYTMDKHPYEYAMIAHNYATAMIGFPDGKLHNHLNNADRFFKQSLEIRSPDKYPLERAMTLLNRLELFWYLHNESPDEESSRLSEMQEMINEIASLTRDDKLLSEADFHQQKLSQLLNVI